MELVSARCTSCGGEIQLDQKRETGYCMHCGSKVIVKDAIKNIRIDQSHLIENYMSILNTALEGENYQQVEEYCNKILEINPKEPDIWFFKGKSIGWESSARNNNFQETIACWVNAIKFSEEDNTEIVTEIINKIRNEGVELSGAFVVLSVEQFMKYPDGNNAQIIGNNLSTIEGSLNKLNNQTSKNIFDVDQILTQFLKPINDAIIGTYIKVVFSEYQGRDHRPNEFDFNKYLERSFACTNVLDKLVRIGNDDDPEKLTIYENLLLINKNIKEACSWDYTYVKSVKIWYKNLTVNQDTKNEIDSLVLQYAHDSKIIKDKIAENKRKHKIAEQEKYWKEHPEEYEIYLKVKPLKDQIVRLNNERSTLGIFSRKEKREIDEEIKKIQIQIDAISIK